MTLTLLAALAVTLAACSATATSSTDATGGQTAASTANAAGTPVPNASLPVLTRLLIGTFKLEDTELAVTPDQAKTLLPLWQAVRSLGSSSTTATAEMTALEKQIQETLTAEQMDRINAMPLTRADLQTLAGDLGISFGSGNQANATGTPGAQTFPDGGFPGGGIPPDGGAPPGGSLTTEQQATLEARRASQPNVGVPTQFLDALIQMLEAKGLP
jgi:hypothetical protein